MALLDSLKWSDVRNHYDARIKASRNIQSMIKTARALPFSEYALGITDDTPNYSAAEHHLGPRILATNVNAHQRVFDLAGSFLSVTSALQVPPLIRAARLKNLSISVGSELSCLVNPDSCWVANTRTAWTHLVLFHDGNISYANEQLKLYRKSDVDSEMAYENWTAIHAELGESLQHLSRLSIEPCRSAGTTPGSVTFLWADAIASFFYGSYHD